MGQGEVVVDGRRRGWFWMDHDVLAFAPEIGPIGIAVYAMLASHADGDHQAYPGQRGLAKRLGIGPNTLVRTLRQLEQVGLISIESRLGAKRSKATNLYTLLARGGPKGEVVSPQDQGGVTTVVTGGGVTVVGPPPTTVTKQEPVSLSSSFTDAAEKKQITASPLLPAVTVARARVAAPKPPVPKRVPIPPDLKLTPRMAEVMAKAGCRNPQLAFEAYVDNHTARATQYVAESWEGACWRTWARQHDKFGCPCMPKVNGRAYTPPPPPPKRELSAEAKRLQAEDRAEMARIAREQMLERQTRQVPAAARLDVKSQGRLSFLTGRALGGAR